MNEELLVQSKILFLPSPLLIEHAKNIYLRVARLTCMIYEDSG